MALVWGLLRFRRRVAEMSPVITIHLQTRRVPTCCCNQAFGHNATGTGQMRDPLALAA